MESSVLLQAVGGVARAVRSLYGPNKLRKQVTDEFDQTLFSSDAYTVASVLKSQNAGTAILQQALDEQHRVFGTGCTTMLTLCGVLAEAALELQRQGLPTGIIRQALDSVERCCLSTAKHMRMPLTEAIPAFDKLSWSRQLATLGRLLSNAENSIATSLAVEVASILDPIRFCAEEASLRDLVTAHVVLGGVTSATSSQIRGGVLLPIAEAASRSCLRRRFSSATDGTIEINGGVVVLAGDLETIALPPDSSIQIIFVQGDISTQVVDASASTLNAPLCVSVSSYNALRQLAEMSGAEMVDSWKELLPSAIGHDCLQLNTMDISMSTTHDDDDDDENEFATFFLQISIPKSSYQLHASVIVQGPTRSLAVELRDDTRKMISRVRNVLRSGYVVPGNGGLWCACIAAVTMESETQAKSNLELLSFATSRLVDPLTQLGVFLLENSASDIPDNSFFSRLARVRTVQKCFARGVVDVGADKFYSRYYDFRSADYALLSSKTTEPESEDGRRFHADEYKSFISAVKGAFRVIQFMLNIDHHHIN